MLDALPRSIAAVLLTLAIAACTKSQSHPDSSPPRLDLPADFCQQLGFDIPSKIYGDPVGSGIGKLTTNRIDCSQLYFGLEERPGGVARVSVTAFDSAELARKVYDGRSASAAPFGGTITGPDDVQYIRNPSELGIEAVRGNLVIVVELAWFSGAREAATIEDTEIVLIEFANDVFETVEKSIR